ncbi:MAG: methyl-accepting chemotaxis protein [Phenylobacterium sp.]|jgi:methyl-accepting chemotaxis protein
MTFSLKVVHKVYISFGIIAALLIASSLAADAKLGHISDSTLQVNDLAVPVLKQSNQLQITLLKQAKLSTLSFNHTTLEQVSDSRTQFQQATEQFSKNYQQVATLVSNDSKSSATLNEANNSYQQYILAVGKMLDGVQSRIEYTIQLNKTHEDLKIAIDEGGSRLLDIGELETGANGNTELLGQFTGLANQLDGYLFKFIGSARQIVVMTTLDEVAQSKDDVGFGISDLNAQFGYLNSLSEDIETNGMMEKVMTGYANVRTLMVEDNNLVQVKQSQLEQVLIAQEQVAQADLYVNQASLSLDKLLTQTDLQFNALQQQVLQKVDDGQQQLRSVMIILTICSLIATFITTRALTPLKGINQVLRYMAQGDLSRKLKVSSNDEFGELSGNINDVVSDLTSLVQQIVDSSTKLTTNLTEVVENSSKDILEMSEFVELQRVKVDEVNQITESLDQSTHFVVEQANTAVAEMNQSLEQSKLVDGIAQANNKRIGALATKLDQATQNIDQLQIESSMIGGIIETIRTIADQTNLLALNAAIEAARAGEQGRGFAVVAGEVRSLAGRTQQSTTEIQTMIEKLQKQIGAAVSDISSGQQQVTECVKYTDELTESLAMINQAINRIHGMNAEIAESAQQQRDQSNQIKDKVSDVLEIAEKNAEKSRSTMEHSNTIASLADELDNSVHTFKV